MTSTDLIKIRLEKLKKIRKLGIDPYPSVSIDKIPISKILAGTLDSTVEVSGRLSGFREHGKITFSDCYDESGKIQLAFKEDIIGAKDYEFLKLLDSGDFFFTEGKLFKTKAGEITVEVSKFQLLSKSLRPLPSEWFGFKDSEERYRQRYVDFNLNPETKELFRKKAKFWNSIRNFMIEKGFLEVETPVLENTAGGADATPFETHYNTLDIDVYLRISMGELWQKRLMVGGFEKTFELGRQFRNEGMSREHLQDYTQMEFYWAYANYEDSMKLVEEMYKKVAFETFGVYEFEINGFKVNLNRAWTKVSFPLEIKKHYGIDMVSAKETDLRKKLKEVNIAFNKNDSKGRLLDQLWKNIRKEIAGPSFLVDQPVEVSPLAKRKRDNPALVERYQVLIAGSELGNGYSELNDPIDQAQRFREQQEMREKGDEEAQMEDYDFVRALEYGMPPVTGFGVSERLFSFLANKSMRECVMFPLLKPEDPGDFDDILSLVN